MSDSHMGFTFIHTADWQLGKPFGGFPDSLAPLLQQARLDCIERIATAAKASGARHVIVAGDVFDSRTPSADLLRRAFATLAAERDIVWHLLPGNHDPAESGSFWHRTDLTLRAPNVRLLLASKPSEIEPGVVLLPAPLMAKSMATDPTAWMDACETPAGTIRIGVAHGSVQGFGSEGDAAVPIAPERPRLARLAYLALGDWHGVAQISDRVWYSGTPEPDQFPANRPGFVLRVDVETVAASPRVSEIATAQFTWTKRAVTVSTLSDIDLIARDVSALGPAAQRLLLELTVSGQVSLGDASAIDAALDRLASDVRYLRHKTERLTVVAGTSDIAQLPDGIVRSVAERLQQEAAAGDPIAPVALRKLMLLAATESAQGAS
jgi:DNA repair exonuclease SbcCD nuclease subunit